MRLALVHDWLNQIGGAEDVLQTLVGMFPDAPVYTSMYWSERMPAAYREWNIRTTWMDRLPGIYRHHQPYLPFYPVAFGGLGSVVGAFVGGILLGVIESMGSYMISGGWADAISYGAFLLVLMFRPEGLFGRPAA